jgi:hypothetical protein
MGHVPFLDCPRMGGHQGADVTTTPIAGMRQRGCGVNAPRGEDSMCEPQQPRPSARVTVPTALSARASLAMWDYRPRRTTSGESVVAQLATAVSSTSLST